MRRKSRKTTRKIRQLASYRLLRACFNNSRLRRIDKHITFEHNDIVYLVNTYYYKNIIKLFDKEALLILDLFSIPLSFDAYLRNFQETFGINLVKPNQGDVQRANDLFHFTKLLIDKKILVHELFNEHDQIRKYQARAWDLLVKPHAILIVASLKCNLRCPGCCLFSHEMLENMPAHMTKDVFDRHFKFVLTNLPKRDYSTLTFKFYGGEALLNKKLVNYGARTIRQHQKQGSFGKRDIKIVLTTNGTLIDEDVVRMVKKYNMNIGVSLDGVGKSNDAQRIFPNGKGTFRAIVKGINLLKANAVHYSLSVTIGPANIDAMPDDLAWMANNLNNPPIFLNVMQGIDNGGDPFSKLSDQEFFSKMHAIYDRIKHLNLWEGRIKSYCRWARNEVPPFPFYCIAVSSGQYVLRPDGKIGFCNHTILGGDEAQYRWPKDVTELLKINAFPDWRGRSPLFMSECFSHCPYFALCPGGCAKRAREINGSVFSTSTEQCRVERFFIERGIIESLAP